jgi:hypothetical protein
MGSGGSTSNIMKAPLKNLRRKKKLEVLDIVSNICTILFCQNYIDAKLVCQIVGVALKQNDRKKTQFQCKNTNNHMA